MKNHKNNKMKNLAQIYSRRMAIVVLFGALFFATLFGTYFLNKKYYGRMEDGLINQYFAPTQKMQAQYLAAKLSDKAKNSFSSLKVSAEFKNLQDISVACADDQKTTLEQIAISLGEGISHLSLIDNKGKVICATVEEMEGKDISALPHIQEQLAAKKPIVSRLFTNPLGEKLISFTVPIFSSGGEHRGALGVALKQEYLKQFLSSDSSLIPGGYNALIDDDGAILYHPNESFVGENIFGEKIQEAIKRDPDLNSMYKKMMEGKTGYDFYTFQDNVKVAGYAPIALFDGDRFWSVASTANLKDYAIFTKPFFVKGLIINLLLMIGVFILILPAVYFLQHFTRERERERRGEREKSKSDIPARKKYF